MGFRRRQVLTAALTANAIRPLPGFRTGIPAFSAGWPTSEMAPHLLALTAASAAHEAINGGKDRKRDVLGLALAGASMAGLGYLIRQSRGAGDVAEAALTDALGDYQAVLDTRMTPAELATPWRRIAYPFRNKTVGVRIRRNIAYNDNGRRGRLDIYSPEVVPEKAPVLLQVHGGGWTIGTKDQQGLPLMNHLAAKGWVCVAINYRLSPRNDWPAHIVDVKQAIAWIRENIDQYGGDPDYIAITGGSAGGHLTALAAVTPNDPAWQPGFEDADTSVACAVPHYGVYDFAGATGLKSADLLRDKFLGPFVLKSRYSRDAKVFEDASPLLRITPEAPDFFVLHGINDTLVDVGQARAFVQRLKEVSEQTVVYAELPGTQHAFDVFNSIRSAHIVRAIDRYLHWHWNTWRKGLDHEDTLTEASQAP